MSVKFISVKCPECGADLEMEEGRKQMFYSYCGAKVMLQNENEYTIRTVDEARIREAEVNRELRLKELELEKQRKSEEDNKNLSSKNFFKKRIKIYLILTIIGAVPMLLDLNFTGTIDKIFTLISMVGLCGLGYGSIIHGIILIRANTKE